MLYRSLIIGGIFYIFICPIILADENVINDLCKTDVKVAEDPDNIWTSDEHSICNAVPVLLQNITGVPKAAQPTVAKVLKTSSGVLEYTIVRDISDILLYSGERTKREANEGAVLFFRSALLANPSFLYAAKSFYTRIREIDSINGKIVPFIENTAPQSIDVYKIALEVTNNDPYLAFKVLAVYGHDDWNRKLYRGTGDSCDLQELDRTAPRPNSIIFKNGAIAPLKYSESEIKTAKKIAADCSNINGKFHNLILLCNEYKASYLADYYHVILAAFLGCREEYRNRIQDTATSGFVNTVRNTVDPFYLEQVKKYKIERFSEEVDWLAAECKKSQEDPSCKGVPLLVNGFKQIKDGFTGDPSTLIPNGIDRNEDVTKAVIAVMRRQIFEIAFRVRQHEMGMSFGINECKYAPVHCTNENRQ